MVRCRTFHFAIKNMATTSVAAAALHAKNVEKNIKFLSHSQFSSTLRVKLGVKGKKWTNERNQIAEKKS